MFGTALFWFCVCVCLACIEIESEGKWGWAEKAPTWYRTTGPVARAYGLLMGGRPLTGYHAFMFALPLLILHVPFVSGVAWSAAEELHAASLYFIVGALWDYLWFVLNPHYGPRGFKKTTVWWHAKSAWVFGLFPADYLYATMISAASAYAAARAGGDMSRFTAHLAILGCLLGFTLITIVVAPLYHRWYRAMRLRDDRDKTAIFHAD